MESTKNIIIGFGKAGKTLAKHLGNQGEEVVLIEKSPKMYGGTCINVACIPSKKLITLAENIPENANKQEYYTEAVETKNTLINKLNETNYESLAGVPNVSIVDGYARFLDEQTILVEQEDKTVTYNADRIFINTGSKPIIPPVDGLEIGGPIYTSETLMELTDLPEELVIIGAGTIGLEFASMYAHFGSNVTMLDNESEDNFYPI